MPAAAAEEADADALAHRPAFNAFADHVDASDGFVARHPRPLDRHYPLHRRGIRMAHATGLDEDADMACRRIKQRLFGQLQLAWTDSMDGPIRFCGPGHSPLLSSRLERFELRSMDLSLPISVSYVIFATFQDI